LGTHFLIETHSEALINRLGALILEGKLSQENVQILIFETNGTKTDVRTAIFDEEGQLIGWPYGFFQPDA